MQESTLLQIALYGVLIGFLGLISLFFFQKPVIGPPQQDLVTTMTTTITTLTPTSKGTMITFMSTQQGYFSANMTLMPEQLLYQKVRLTGKQDGELFYISSIEVLTPNDHS